MTRTLDADRLTSRHATDMSLPTAPEQISAQWLTCAFAFKYPDVEVTEATITEVILGTSTKIRVAVTYNKAGVAAKLPASLIVKGGFDESNEVMGNLYLVETRSYRDAAPMIDLNLPACYYAGRDPATNHTVLVLEDMSLRNVRFLDAYATQTFEQCRRRLDAMAKYHAQTWDSLEFLPGGRLDWVPVRYDTGLKSKFDSVHSIQVAMNRHWLTPDVWQSFMELPRGAATPKPLRDLEWMRHALTQMAIAHEAEDTCLLHGDTHLGNLYEESDGTPGFYDIQAARGPWSMEVSYHLVGALEVADRRRWEQPLLAYYLERLATYGVDAPGFDVAWRAYCRDIVHGLFIWLINENHWQPEAINTANAARFGMAAIDCGTKELLS